MCFGSGPEKGRLGLFSHFCGGESLQKLLTGLVTPRSLRFLGPPFALTCGSRLGDESI